MDIVETLRSRFQDFIASADLTVWTTVCVAVLAALWLLDAIVWRVRLGAIQRRLVEIEGLVQRLDGDHQRRMLANARAGRRQDVEPGTIEAGERDSPYPNGPTHPIERPAR